MYKILITKSIVPESIINLKRITPNVDPKIPPINKKSPISKSILFLLLCAEAPEIDEPKIWLASVATAVAGGMPKKIKIGVIKNPPPTPNNPDKKPTKNPDNKIIIKFISMSAIGR